MKLQFTISSSWLRVMPAMTINLSAGLFLLAFGIADFLILLIDLGSAILLVILARFIEEVLEQI